MQFKKFVADGMREALAAIKSELGPDAMIVATRQLDGGLFKKPRLEVTAALEEGVAPAAAAPTRRVPQSSAPPASQPSPSAGPTRTTPSGQSASQIFARYAAAAQEEEDAESATQDDPVASRIAPLRQEIRALRQQVEQSEQESPGQAVLEEIAGLRDMLSRINLKGGASPVADALSEVLGAADVEPGIATELCAAARARAERQVGDDHAPLLRDELVALKQVIAAELSVDTSFFSDLTAPRRIALIGPTGVGKTTTIAKIAAHAALVHQRSVALISLDTYRVAAFEQLRQYASLIDVPLTIARDAAGFAAAMRAYDGADLILVDTAGRGTADKSHHSHLCELFSAHRVQAYLALSAATRRLELRGILRAFAALDPQALVFTKLDEAMALGAVINASRACAVPLTFVTHGQRVPEDFGLPDATDLAARLVHTVLDSARSRARRVARPTPRRPKSSQAAWGDSLEHDAI